LNFHSSASASTRPERRVLHEDQADFLIVTANSVAVNNPATSVVPHTGSAEI
jgi:hypothetical protein